MKKKKEPEKDSSGRWMLTYSDMITLLMAFFIVLYATSNINLEKYKKLSTSLNSALGSSSSSSSSGGTGTGSGGSGSGKTGGKINVTGLPTMSANEKLNVSGLDFASSSSDDSSSGSTSTQGSGSDLWYNDKSQAQEFQSAQKDFNKYVKDNNLGSDVTVGITTRGLEVSMKESILFNSAEAALKPDAMNKLISIGKILKNVEGKIRVEGNTDNLPIKNDRYNSNWQLSSIRASNVAELLIEKSGVDPSRVTAVGNGEYKPVASNATPEGRAQNRRVNIVIIDDKYDAVEGTK